MRTVRSRSVVGLLVVAAVAALAGCDFPHIVPDGRAPLRYRDQLFSNVTKTADVTYAKSVNLSQQVVTLKLDVYRAVGDPVRRRPAIVWVHGGSFCCGDKASPEILDEASTFARKGYVSASINYRLEPGGCSAAAPTPECIEAIRHAMQDAQKAVRFLRKHASTYGIDPTRIAIAGTSAGAITALNVGFSSREYPPGAVRAAVALSGSAIIGTMGPGDAPSLLFHGTNDPLVPYGWAQATFENARARGLDSFLTTWPGAGHVPYVQHRQQILDETRNFLYWEMDLAHAAQ
jgi:acetyl esterase/lipase